MTDRASTSTVSPPWSAIVAAFVLLCGTYVAGYELLRSWLFTVAFVFAAVSGLGVVASALWPRALRGRGSAWPLPVAVVPPVVTACVVGWYFAGDLTVVRVGLAAALTAIGVSVVARAADVVGVPRPVRVPAWLQVPGIATVGTLTYLDVTGHLSFLTVAFLLSTFLFSLYVWVVVPLGIIDRRTEAEDLELPDPAPDVSVLIPAYNERETISRSVESVLASDYPGRLRCYVVDDGSTDGTGAILRGYDDDRLTVLRKENGGKYSALNYGLLCSTGDIVVTIDADSVLEPDAIRRSVAKLAAYPDTAAIAGNVKVENRDRLLTRLQALEYIVGINTVRRAFALFGVVPVIPGCLGVFRRDALDEIDGYDPDTATEDFDLTVKLLKAGWAVRTTEAVVWTEAPFTWRDFYSQRRRWAQGGLETLYKHVDLLTATDVGFLNRFMYPLKAVSLLSVPLILPAIAIAVALGPYRRVAELILFFAVIMALVAAVSLAFERESIRLMAYFPFFVVGYRQFLDFMVLCGLAAMLHPGQTEWGKITRAGRTIDDAAMTTTVSTTTTETTNE